jgi:hypothetical protein
VNSIEKLIAATGLVSVLLLYGCMGSTYELKAKYIIGKVVVVGNEPFTNIAVQTSPTNTLVLNCDIETKNFLLNNQGQTVRIFYDKIDDSATPKAIFVKKYEIVHEEKQ